MHQNGFNWLFLSDFPISKKTEHAVYSYVAVKAKFTEMPGILSNVSDAEQS